MKISEFDIATAEGIVLLNDIRLDNHVLPQGHRLSHEDIVLLKGIGIKKITGASTSPDDIVASTALGMIAPLVCGEGLAYTVSKSSCSCRLIAAEDGILFCSDERLAKFNRINPYLIINTVLPYKTVKKGDVIGSIKLRCPIIEQSFIDDLTYRLSGNEPLLKISNTDSITAAIIYTEFYNDKSELKHFSNITKRLLKNFPDIVFEHEIHCNHDCNDVAGSISDASTKYSLVFVIPGLPSSSSADTIPSALRSSADEIICENIPQDTLPDLMLANKKNSKIIVVPYHYDKVTSPLADKYIKMAITKDKLFKSDFPNTNNVLMDTIVLTDEEKENIITPVSSSRKNKNDVNIAAVILAAGCSSRARRNKLMIDMDGEPMFMKAVRAAIKSKASPVYVVTGYHAEELEEYLKDLDINILRNNDYLSGVKTSIRLGLRSVPSFCDGAILLPADMPYVSSSYLDKMIKSFTKGQHKQLCISYFDGKKYNPILWGRDLYSKADLVPENSHLRSIFMEHQDYIKLVDADANSCVDINFPYDIEILTNK